MFSAWTFTTDTTPGLAIERPAPNEGALRDHLVAAFARVTMGEAGYWSMIVDGAPELKLREEDVRAIEAHFGVSRLELGGATLRATSADGATAIAEAIVPMRAGALEVFVPELVAAMKEALRADSPRPVRHLLESAWAHATSVAWLVQALVERRRDGATLWNDSAIGALRQMIGADHELELHLGPIGFGDPRVALSVLAGERTLVLVLDALGGATLREGDAFSPIVFPESAAERLTRGELLLHEGEDEEALAHLDAAAALPDVDDVVHFHRAHALHRLGRNDEALLAFARAEARLVGHPRLLARINRATLIAERGEREEALALLRQNIEEFPDAVDAWYALGLSLVKLGRHDESIAAIERALALDPGHGEAHYAIACAFALRGSETDRELALDHIAAAIDCDEDLRESIAEDEDFAALRADPRFAARLAERRA